MPRTLGVAIPHYNDSRYLQEALVSCLEGSRPADRILVIDDGSSDEEFVRVQEIISSLRERFRTQIDCARQPVNLGVVPALNHGLERIGTDCIMFRAADDRTLPGFFAGMMNLFEQHPDAGLGVADIRYCTLSRHEGVLEPLGLPAEGFYSSGDLTRYLSGTNILHSAVVIFDRRKLSEAGGFALDADLYHDWWACHQIAFRHGVVYWPQPGTAFRLRSDSVSSRCFLDLPRVRRSIEAVRLRLACESPVVRIRFDQAHMLGFFDGIGDLRPQCPEGACAPPVNPTGGLHPVLKRRLETFASAIRATRGRILVYGAGNHSRVMLREWDRLGLPTVSGIVVSDPVHSMFGSLPVFGVGKVAPSPADLFILSSKSFEETMAARVRALHPEAHVLSFWNPLHTTLAPQELIEPDRC